MTTKKDNSQMPKHIAIIMDGNRRWAKRNSLKFIFGHRKGIETFENVLRYLGEKGLRSLTVYAFSTENWSRGDDEVQGLLELLSEYLFSRTDEFMKNDVVFNVIGNKSDFSEKLQNGLSDLEEKTRNNKGIILNVALSYGGRDEILRGVNRAIKEGKEVTEEEFGKMLDFGNQEDPEIIIRTGGAKRLSNFIPWQGIYSELFFVDTLWPDFTIKELDEIIEEYGDIKRNFGK